MSGGGRDGGGREEMKCGYGAECEWWVGSGSGKVKGVGVECRVGKERAE